MYLLMQPLLLSNSKGFLAFVGALTKLHRSLGSMQTKLLLNVMANFMVCRIFKVLFKFNKKKKLVDKHKEKY